MSLLATRLLPQCAGLAPVLVRRAASLSLDWNQRQRSRLRAADSLGREVGVVLARGQLLRGGDGLLTDEGELLRVQAALQAVLQVRGSPFELMRAAYHLGNRHVALELTPQLLQLEPDLVLADMLRGLGLQVSEGLAAFEPEGGAYGKGATGFGHGHGHEHEHDHDHEHEHEHEHEHDQDHSHAPSHDQDHVHGHQHGRSHEHHHHDHDHSQCTHPHHQHVQPPGKAA